VKFVGIAIKMYKENSIITKNQLPRLLDTRYSGCGSANGRTDRRTDRWTWPDRLVYWNILV